MTRVCAALPWIPAGTERPCVAAGGDGSFDGLLLETQAPGWVRVWTEGAGLVGGFEPSGAWVETGKVICEGERGLACVPSAIKIEY